MYFCEPLKNIDGCKGNDHALNGPRLILHVYVTSSNVSRNDCNKTVANAAQVNISKFKLNWKRLGKRLVILEKNTLKNTEKTRLTIFLALCLSEFGDNDRHSTFNRHIFNNFKMPYIIRFW